MKQTVHYKLNKPDGSDYAKVQALNENADLIDAALQGLEERKAGLGPDGKLPVEQLPEMDFDPAGSAGAVDGKLSAHVKDTTAHVTAAERAKWNGAATAADFKAHTGDGTRHITAAERTAWNGKSAGNHTHTAAQVGAYTKAEVDAKIGAFSKFASGTYLGTGTSGPNAPNKLTFSFVPKLVIVRSVYGSTDNILWLSGMTRSSPFLGPAGGDGNHLQFNPTGTTLSWNWSREGEATYQQNGKGQTYSYAAFGV